MSANYNREPPNFFEMFFIIFSMSANYNRESPIFLIKVFFTIVSSVLSHLFVLKGKTRRQLAQRPTTEEEPGRERRWQDVRSTGQGASQNFQSVSGGVPQVGQGQVAGETPWLRDDSLMMTSNFKESTTRDDEIEDQGSQPSGKRKRPMAGGVVFSDGQRVSDVQPEEPPPPRCPKRERYIQSLLRFKGVETRPLWADALPVFYDITTNISR